VNDLPRWEIACACDCHAASWHNAVLLHPAVALCLEGCAASLANLTIGCVTAANISVVVMTVVMMMVVCGMCYALMM
jgi:hypothetical protein